MPGYIGGAGSGGGQISWTNVPYFSQANIDYTLSWLRGARGYHKTPVDFLGFWNEAGQATIGYVKAMRKALDGCGIPAGWQPAKLRRRWWRKRAHRDEVAPAVSRVARRPSTFQACVFILQRSGSTAAVHHHRLPCHQKAQTCLYGSISLPLRIHYSQIDLIIFPILPSF